MGKFEELLEVQLLLAEDVSIGDKEDRLWELEQRLQKVFETLSLTSNELKLDVSRSGMVRKAIKLGEKKLCHARLSFRFEYEAEKPMPKLLQWDIIPKFYRDHIHQVLNTPYSTTIRNLYTMGYMQTLGRELGFTVGAVTDLLKKDGHL